MFDNVSVFGDDAPPIPQEMDKLQQLRKLAQEIFNNVDDETYGSFWE